MNIVARVLAVALVFPLGFTSCTTINTVHGIPTTDREQKAIKEAQFAGAAGGALLGAALAGGLGYAAGYRDKQLALIAGAGAGAGGVAGYQQGTQRGVQLVTNHRGEKFRVDKLREAVKNARAYNAQADAYNDRLRARVREIQKTKNAVEAGRELRSAQNELNKITHQMKIRNQQADNLPSGFSSTYRETNKPLGAEKETLKDSISMLRAVSQEKG